MSWAHEPKLPLPAGVHTQAAALSKSWGDILTVFDELLRTLKENFVPKVLVQVGCSMVVAHKEAPLWLFYDSSSLEGSLA